MEIDFVKFYELADGDYEEAIKRLMNPEVMLRLMKMFIKDQSCQKLCSAVETGDIAAAFAAAHTLKGLSGNFSFGVLYKASCELTDQLRDKTEPADPELFARVKNAYEKVISAWEQCGGSLTE